ncbi:putative protein N(5)-glutamine methyltransferase [Agromyces endophyticus]|uniref:putative protein N(5)-glutamine methyltransferase n=1 Tax=Agromyces sp. H17E-10 TaxID=2932244 RepID=UPI001FCFD175|nr:putative protein N(5)-glutamine methyltransferase [Agromyces sp. H17E-10]UOQ88606.1 putative protein N(5)-glutamine methyltransferase [Agromyces sp. H17E-10]
MPAAVDPALVARLRAAGCVFAEAEAELLVAAAGDDDTRLESLVARRVAGEPIEYVVGWAEFAGLRLDVEPGAFVPRHRTELLAAEATRLARAASGAHGRPAVVVDLCCGVGAIGAVILESAGEVELFAADLDPAAVRAARRNLEPRGGRVFEGDLYDALPAGLVGRIDVLAVNAPYVPSDAIALMPPEAREHEALLALDGGDDGLDVHRRVVASARRRLAPGGALVIETSEDQAETAVALMRRGGLEPRLVPSDDVDDDTVVVVGVRGGWRRTETPETRTRCR